MHKSDGSGMRLTKENLNILCNIPVYYHAFTTAQDAYAKVTEQRQNTIIVTF